MPVDKCVCFDVPFIDLLERHRSEGLTLEQLSDETGCCQGCGMCENYLRLAMVTGETSLPPMPEAELLRRISAARSGPPSSAAG
ncbi:MAG: hypothetical protein AAF108_00690 [Planctomycetota bacterium]